MGSELSSLVGEYLEHEKFDAGLSKKIMRKFSKSDVRKEEGLVQRLRQGNVDDRGRNEDIILGACPPHVRLRAYSFLLREKLDKADLADRICGDGLDRALVVDALVLAFTRSRRTFAQHGAAVQPGPGTEALLVLRSGVLVVVPTAEKDAKTGDGPAGEEPSPVQLQAGAVVDVGVTCPGGVAAAGRRWQRRGLVLRAQEHAVVSVVSFNELRSALQSHSDVLRALADARRKNGDGEAAAAAAARAKAEAVADNLFAAVAACDVRQVRSAVSGGVSVDTRHHLTGHTPLLDACVHRHMALVQTLLELGAGVETGSALRSRTPLHACSLSGWAEGAEALLRAGARVDTRDTAGATPLHLAAAEGHVAVLRLLVAAARAGGCESVLRSETHDGVSVLASCATQAARRVVRPKGRLGYAVPR